MLRFEVVDKYLMVPGAKEYDDLQYCIWDNTNQCKMCDCSDLKKAKWITEQLNKGEIK